MKGFFADLLYLAALAVLSHLVGESLPRRWFRCDGFLFRSADWEENGRIYDRLHIRAWKDRVPDMSRILRDMMPKRLDPHGGLNQPEKLAVETCVAELVHWALIPAAIPCIWRWPGSGGWIIFLLWALGNLPFIMIQRYNRPRLVSLAGRLSIMAQRQERACVL